MKLDLQAFSGRLLSAPILAGSLIFTSGCARPAETRQNSPAPNRVLTAPTGAQITAQVEDGQWTMPAKDYSSSRYSGLDEINAANVASLKLAWSFSTGVLRGHEAAPIVANNTMFIVTPYPNILYALDLTLPGSPIKWKYEPNPSSSSQGVACCDFVNRGAVYSEGKIFFNTLDDHTIALDSATGK